MRLTKAEESRYRRQAGQSRCPIEVVEGDSPPKKQGEAGYSEFKNGGRCEYPGSAMRKGYKVVYIRSTLRVEVGKGYVVKDRIKKAIQPVRRIVEFAKLDESVPPGILADWLDDVGYPKVSDKIRQAIGA